MASIYDKALKRKDFSGIVNKDAVNKDAKGASKKDAAKADEPKAGADIGKIVNLMASDASRISLTTAALYFIYGGEQPIKSRLRCTDTDPPARSTL